MYSATITIASNIHENQTRFVGFTIVLLVECVVSATTADLSASEMITATINKKANM